MNANDIRRAFSLVYTVLRSGEQTEAHIFATAENRGVPASAVNEAIGVLVAKRIVRETMVGTVDALVMA